jgi:lipopolysaccharide biosynthesis protein
MKKVAVCLQLYHINLWPEFEKLLRPISDKIKLYVAICEDENFEVDLSGFDHQISIHKNYGVDIAPFLHQIRCLEEDLFIKIHSKKSKFGNNNQVNWRVVLLNDLIGSKEVFISNVESMLSDQSCGMICNEAFLLSGEMTNAKKTKHLCQIIGMNYDLYKNSQFAAGNMFMSRTKLFQNRLNQYFSKLDLLLTSEVGKVNCTVDGTYSHSLERIFGYIIKEENLKFCFPKQEKIKILNRNAPNKEYFSLIKMYNDECYVVEIPTIFGSYQEANNKTIIDWKHTKQDSFKQIYHRTAEKTLIKSLSYQLAYSQFYERQEPRAIPSCVKTIAFYLPQFHETSENNKWWGKGFTEWTNTSKTLPRFSSHYQPRVPHPDIGYYDLDDDNVLDKQVKIAKSSGVDGFCFYYYWFGGKKLLDKPINNFIQRQDIDHGFIICWANENWTRRWDGLDNEILIEQQYEENWDIRFIEDVSVLFQDRRYICINKKPIIIIYKLSEIPNAELVINNWRQWCRDNGIGEISVWAVYDSSFFNHEPSFIDKFVEFPPRPISTVEQLDKRSLACNQSDAYIYDYEKFVDSILQNKGLADSVSFPIYRCVMMGWDNYARRKEGWSSWAKFSGDKFYSWCRKVWEYTVRAFPENERFIFVNGWNEWGEGTYLEPDARFGYANINTLSRAINKLPNRPGIIAKGPATHANLHNVTIIVHLHLYFSDLLDEFIDSINCIPTTYDLIVTVCDQLSLELVKSNKHRFISASNISIKLVPNRGRDLGPFIVELSDIIDRYEFVLHIHSKKSRTVSWGHLWRRYLAKNLLGSESNVKQILSTFLCNPDIGIIGVPIYAPISTHLSWGPGQKSNCQDLLNDCLGDSSTVPSLPDEPDFSAGSFFWARTNSIRQLFSLGLTYESFESEDQQVESTLAETIERVLPYLARCNQYSYEKVVAFDTGPGTSSRKRIAIYVYFGKETSVSAEDEYFIKSLYSEVDYLLLVSNSRLSPAERLCLDRISSNIYCRDNVGYDFGAWKDSLTYLGMDFLSTFDELLLVNSSCIGPFIPWSSVFETMEKKNDDFWGLTIFPELCDSNRPEAVHFLDKRIPRHIQSFFLAFTNKVFTSQSFQDYWKSVAFTATLTEAVARFECTLTEHLAKSGFSYSAYVEDHEPFQLHASTNPNFNAIYNFPYQMLTIGSPVIKNKLNMMHENQLSLVKEFLAKHTDYPSNIFENWI